MSFVSVDELKTFKKMTGGDSLYAEFKGQQAFEFTYNGLLWFCMNRLPKFGGDDGQWVYDRIMVVNCPNVIPKDKQDKKLLDKMYAEREGIVFKAIQALQRVIANGYRFTEPHSLDLARERYMTENNTVISFFEECMCERPGNKIVDSATTGRIYNVYRAWCVDNNNGYAKTAKEFREALSAHLGKPFKDISVHTNRGTYYRNHTLTLEAKEQYSRVYGYDSTEFLS
jgi:P4 family phage/plasmid primase-like protien